MISKTKSSPILECVKIPAWWLAAKFRPVILLNFVRFLNNYLPSSNFSKSWMSLFDPNNLRKMTRAKIRRTEVKSWGEKGEFMLLDLSEHIDYNFYMKGKFDDLSFAILRTLPYSKNCIFIDIGANIGTESIGIGFRNEVLAIEPQPRIYARLRENVSLNKVINFHLVNCFLTSPSRVQKSRTVELYVPQGNSGAASAQSAWNPSLAVPNKLEIETKTLDMVLGELGFEHGPNYFMKMDAEGHELEILQGAIDFLKHSNPVILMEYRPDLLELDTKRQLLDYIFLELREKYLPMQVLRADNPRGIFLAEFIRFEEACDLLLVPMSKYEEISNVYPELQSIGKNSC